MEFTDTTILTEKLCLKNYNQPTNDKMRGFKTKESRACTPGNRCLSHDS